METTYTKSDAEKYPTVTTHSVAGGIGLGRLIGDRVFVSGGNGFYYPDLDLESYDNDGGNGYMLAVEMICGYRPRR